MSLFIRCKIFILVEMKPILFKIRYFALTALCVSLRLTTLAEIKSVDIGVDGLTCSACSRSVEMSLRKLDFVDSVAMDLSNNNGRVFFKKMAIFSIEKLAKAITDAGYSVRYLNAVFNVIDLAVDENFCWSYENEQYQFVKVAGIKLNGDVTLKFVGEKYLSKKENKIWEPVVTNAKGKGCKTKNFYYVTIV